VALAAQPGVAAEDGEPFIDYWKTLQGDGIVQLQRCALFKNAPSTALCGTIVWDAEVDNPRRATPLDCNRKVFEANRLENGVWKGGWAFDTRKKRFYSATLRVKEGQLHVRAFVGSEVNGETEIFQRVTEVPKGCEGRSPESTSVKGVG
jgi:uncharacterized protein (DUF2147 family)